jgi:hypothetical protein
MDIIIVSAIGTCSIVGLIFDYRNRQKFNKFEKTNEQDNYVVKEGIVKSDSPIVSTFHGDTKITNLLINQVETFLKHHHTYLYEKEVYQDEKRSIRIPMQTTMEEWKSNGIFRHISPKITMQYNGSELNLFLASKKNIFFWDRQEEQIINDTKTKEQSLINGQMKTIFARKIDNNEYDVEIIGTRSEVMDQARYDHFNISNWKTFLLSDGLILSAGFFGNKIYDRSNRK